MRHIAEKLQLGETVTFRPKGNSMVPLIHSGEEVTLAPITETTQLAVGDVVLCKVKSNIYLHKIYAIGPDNKSWLIGNNKGYKNGWTRMIYGHLVKKVP